MTKTAPGLVARLRAHAIPLRIGALSALLLGALIVSTLIMAWDFAANQRRISAATERFHRLQIAAGADRHFGALRYWMTDLSVSLLTLSERRAAESRALLETDLDQLATFAPEAIADVRAATETYVQSAMKAVDAYTAGNRILGNTHLAAARVGSDEVDAALSSLVNDLSADAAEANRRAAASAKQSQRRAIIACAVIVLLGAICTWLVLRSILRPLARIDQAMGALNDGRAPTSLPADGPDEFGRIARTLRSLHESQTARRALEASAAEQQRTIVTAIETIPDGFALFDASDRLVLANHRYREMFATVADLLRPGASFEEILRAQHATGSAVIGDTPLEAWLEDRLRRHRDPAGQREEIKVSDGWLQVTKRKTPDAGTVAVYSDITEIKLRQAEVEEARRGAEAANEAKSRFLAAMSHELRTPLNAIIGYSEMLIEDCNDSGQTEQVPDLERIMISGKSLLSLINDILDLSKIEAGKMELFVERFDVATLIDDVAATIAPMVQKNGNGLVVTLAPGLGAMETDKTKLRQNLFNLLSNATKFTKDGTVELSVSVVGNHLRFSVRDKGIGMTEAQQHKLFQAFVQADNSTTRNFGGTGLGLAIVKQFTEMLGGEISVVSAPGEGSTFSMTVPAVLTSASEDASSPEQSGVAVLVVDDDPAARRVLSDLLTSEGFHALSAGDATTGLALMRKHLPAAVVLDVIMPERDGWSMLREIKEDPDLCQTPVILATILTDREMGLAFGALDFLTKPIDARVLVERLQGIVAEDGRDVLVVDDDAASRALFRRILVREGWAVREAADGERALAQLAIKRPSVMVLDLMMPNLDGFETLRKVRATEALADLPVIIATSKDLERHEIDWLRANARDVVRKGKDGRAELVAAIRRHTMAPAAG